MDHPRLCTPLWRRPALWWGVLAFFIAALGLLWLGLPPLLKQQAETRVLAQTGHHLRLASVRFNPLRLRLEVGPSGLADPQGRELAGFEALVVDLSVASLPRRAWVFDELRVLRPRLSFEELPQRRTNWTPLLEALHSAAVAGAEVTPSAPPRLLIHELDLDDGEFSYADRRQADGFTSRAAPLRLALRELSTSADAQGEFRLEASLLEGAKLEVGGQVALAPLQISGQAAINGLALERMQPLLDAALPGRLGGQLNAQWHFSLRNTGQALETTITEGQAQLSGLDWRNPAGGGLSAERAELNGLAYGLAKAQLRLEQLGLSGLVLDPGHGAAPLRLAQAGLGGLALDVGARHATLARVHASGAELSATRRADGQIDLLAALSTWAGDAPAQPWTYAIAKIELDATRILLRDAGVEPAAELRLSELKLAIDGYRDQADHAFGLQLNARLGERGHLGIEGKLARLGPRLDLQISLEDLALNTLQPYVATRSSALLAAGRFSARGTLRDDPAGPTYRGSAEIADLGLVEATSGELVLAWRRLATPALSANPDSLEIPELTLSELQTRIIVTKDKTSNFSRLGKAPVAGAAPPRDESAAPKSAFAVRVGRLRLDRAGLYFADESLLLPFATRVYELRGSLAGIGNRAGTRGVLEVEGQVEDYGLARATGRLDLLDPAAFSELKVVFRNVDMPRLSPYSATFSGHRIESGRLDLDLLYRIRERELAGENQIVINKLVLGERVESPSAMDLPLRLAIALLEDADGRIDLGLQVSGRLDEPQFSFGALVWKALGNVLGKLVSSPFRALGALFSNGGGELGEIHFEAGEAQLTPPEREKLTRLVHALGKRPGLRLNLAAGHAEADREALRDRQLRRALLLASGETPPAEGDPGPLVLDEPKIKAALEAGFAARFGTGELAALREGHMAANPGQLTQSLGAGVVSRLGGLLGTRRSLGADEVAGLKGQDFHGLLYQRLRAVEVVGDERLVALAHSRAEYATTTLGAAGLAAERLRLGAPFALEGKAAEVPLRIELTAGER